MIYNFRSKAAESIWHGFTSGPTPDAIQHIARRKLRMLNSARQLEDLRSVIEPDGRHSLRVDGDLRLLFTWHRRGARDVEFSE